LELKWSEVDFENSLIRINPNRMKMRREHIVPLSSYVENQLKIMFEYGLKRTQLLKQMTTPGGGMMMIL